MSWQSILISVVSIILTGLASWAVAKLTEFINSKISNAKVAKWLTSAVTVVADVVKEGYQTYVEELKGKNAFTPEAQLEALNRAQEKAKSLIATEIQTFISTNFGDFDAWLKTQIESAIYTMKNPATKEVAG